MSYCRWSSDFAECDVYVYEDVSGGWTTHVAGRRLRQQVPDEIRNMPTNTGEELFAQYQAEKVWRESLPCDETPCNYTDGKKNWKGVCRSPKDSEYIYLSKISEHAGESFNDATPGECADTLEMLRSSSLNVPQYAIDDLRAEQSEIAQDSHKP